MELHHLIFQVTQSSSPVSHGANALKLDNEIILRMINQKYLKEDIKSNDNDQYHQELLKSKCEKVLLKILQLNEMQKFLLHKKLWKLDHEEK